MRVLLRAVAHARSGDKGDRVNIGVFSRDAATYAALAAQLTPERVRQHFAGIVRGECFAANLLRLELEV